VLEEVARGRGCLTNMCGIFVCVQENAFDITRFR
jgi:hypothetical protein